MLTSDQIDFQLATLNQWQSQADKNFQSNILVHCFIGAQPHTWKRYRCDQERDILTNKYM